jgi:methylamine dehydrogenase accessory protein MauD
MTTLMISNAVLWLLMLGLVAVVWALTRQIGILYERVSPMGALITDAGPGLGQPAPPFLLPTLAGDTLALGGAAARSTLLFFLSPTCPVCKKLLPVLRSVAKDEGDWVRIVLASDGDMLEHLDFYRKANLSPFPYVLSADLGMTYRVSRLPYAVLIDESGVIRAKGLINTREHLESLITAQELGVGSVQEYLRQSAA